MAMINPMRTRVVVSAFIIPTAAVDAINRLEGPANGIRFRPKAVRNNIRNSISEVICLLRPLTEKVVSRVLISTRVHPYVFVVFIWDS